MSPALPPSPSLPSSPATPPLPVLYSQVTYTLTIAGTVETFNATSYQHRLANTLLVPVGDITLEVYAASVIVVARIAAADADAATDIVNALAPLSSISTASTSLGVQVESVQPVTTSLVAFTAPSPSPLAQHPPPPSPNGVAMPAAPSQLGPIASTVQAVTPDGTSGSNSVLNTLVPVLSLVACCICVLALRMRHTSMAAKIEPEPPAQLEAVHVQQSAVAAPTPAPTTPLDSVPSFHYPPNDTLPIAGDPSGPEILHRPAPKLHGFKPKGPITEKLNEEQPRAKELLSAGYSIRAMREKGFTVQQLKAEQVPAAELSAGGFSMREIGEGGYTAAQLRAGGFEAVRLCSAGYQATQLVDAGYSVLEIRDAGYTLSVLRAEGFTATQLLECGSDVLSLFNAGYSLDALRAGGCTAAELRAQAFSAESLHEGGFTATELVAGGYEIRDVHTGGYTVKELIDHEGLTADVLLEGGYSLEDLREGGYPATRLRLEGFLATTLKDLGFSAKELLEGHFSVPDLLQAGYPTSHLKAAGLTATSLTEAGIAAVKLKGVFSLMELKCENISPAQLKLIGFTAQQLKAEMFRADELKAAGFEASELRSAGFHAGELAHAGFGSGLLRAAGYSAWEMKLAGHSASELKALGYESGTVLKLFLPVDLERVGASAAELEKKGSISDLLFDDTYMAHDVLRTLGFNSKEIASQLQQMGGSASDLRAAGCSIVDIMPLQYSATELKQAGFSACELRDSMYYEEIQQVGFSSEELTSANYPAGILSTVFQLGANDLLRAGYPAEDVARAGYSVGALKNAGLSATSLRGAGFYANSMLGHFSMHELREAGYPASDFRSREVKSLLEAGYSIRELKEANFDFLVKACRDLGVIAGELRAEGFSAVQLLRGGYNLKEMSRAGFGDPWQLKTHHNASIKLLVKAGMFADDKDVRHMKHGLVGMSYVFSSQRLRDAEVTNRNGTMPAWICQTSDDGEHCFSPGVPGTTSLCISCHNIKKVCPSAALVARMHNVLIVTPTFHPLDRWALQKQDERFDPI